MNSIVIRADSSTQIGTGHLMRIKTLIHQIKCINDQILFHIVSYPFEGHCLNIFDNTHVKIHQMPIKKQMNDDYLYVTNHLQDDLAFLNAVIKSTKSNVVLIDHYQLSREYEICILNGTKIVSIDDFPERIHNCDILLNQNYHTEISKMHQKSSASLKLLGPDYALLRPEFLYLNSDDIKNEITDVFVNFGGTDPTNETKKVIQMIQTYDLSVHFHIVIGQNYYERHQVFIDQLSIENITIYIQINNISDVMKKCQLAIGAGGSSALERMYMNLVTMTIAVAENQESLSLAMHYDQIGIHLGSHDIVTIDHIYRELNHLIKDTADFIQMQKRLNKKMNKTSVKQCVLANAMVNALEVEAYEKKY